MRVPIDGLTLPEPAAALNEMFKTECLRNGEPVYDANNNLIAVDISRIPLQRAFHKCMLQHLGFKGTKLPPMPIEVPLPAFTHTSAPNIESNFKKDGVGTELKAILNQYGFTILPAYDIFVYRLNEKSPDECAQNIEGILDVLEDEAYRNKTLFDRDRTATLVRLAIRKTRNKQNG